MIFFFISGVLALDRIRVSEGFFVDNDHRIRLFHGVNAVYKQPPFLPQPTGFDPQLSLSPYDMAHLTEWGFNHVRLGVMWRGWEPEDGQVNATFVRDARALVERLGKHGLYVILDQHQDLLNRRFCGEGFPDWAVSGGKFAHRFPWPLAAPYATDRMGYPSLDQCLSKTFGEYYFSLAQCDVWNALYRNTAHVADRFAAFWKDVAETFVGMPSVIGYELINEPFFGDVIGNPLLLVSQRADKHNLEPLYEKIASQIRLVDKEQNVFFEKATGNYIATACGFDEPPGGAAFRNRSVYSFHEYCTPRGAWSSVCDFEAATWVDDGAADAARLGVPGFLTEFGASHDTEQGLAAIHRAGQLADKHLLSWSYWQFKSFKDLTSVGGSGESFYDDNGDIEWDKVKALSRTYAQAIAGIPQEMSFDPETGRFALVWTEDARVTSNVTEIYLNERLYYARGWTASTKGSVVVEHVGRNRIHATTTRGFGKAALSIHPK